MSNTLSRWWWVGAVLIVMIAAVLRLWQLDQIPRALYWEEVALGYDAYSILKTGRDHHGHVFPLLAFESFGDWKPSGYFYAAVPSIALSGLNAWGVRLPSALAGIGLVVAMGWLVAESRRTAHLPKRSILIAMALTAFSPWAIQFSRGAWEANLATFLLTLGVASGWRWVRVSTKKSGQGWQWLLLATVFLIISMYTYHAARTVAPALGIMLLIQWWLVVPRRSVVEALTILKSQIRVLIVIACIAGVLLLPFVLALGKPEFSQRFNETNIFADLQLLQESQKLQAASGDTLLAKLLYHRYIIYSRQLLENALAHFRLDFLFVSGDINPRHSTRYVGLFYLFEVVPLLAGLLLSWRRQLGTKVMVVLWIGILIATISLTKAVPHQLRLLVSLPAWLLCITMGWEGLLTVVSSQSKKLGWLVIVAVICLYAYFFGQYWRYYTTIYAIKDAGAFQYGYEQMVREVNRLSAAQPSWPILIARGNGRPAMYYWFYTQTDPALVQEREGLEKMDSGEFISYRNVQFPLKSEELQKTPAIVSLTIEDVPYVLGETGKNVILSDPRYTLIKNPLGEVVWVVYENP